MRLNLKDDFRIELLEQDDQHGQDRKCGQYMINLPVNINPVPDSHQDAAQAIGIKDKVCKENAAPLHIIPLNYIEHTPVKGV